MVSSVPSCDCQFWPGQHLGQQNAWLGMRLFTNEGGMMPDHLGEFIAARHNANASAATIREMVTQLAIAAVELERWEQANMPYKPGRRRGADPFAGDLTWPSLENAAA